MDELSDNIIKHDKFDKSSYDEVYEESKTLNETVHENKEKLKTVEKLAEDFYYSMYKYVPKKFPEEEISDKYLHNQNIVDKAMETKEYENLRTYTKLKEFESAIATTTLINKMMEELSDEDLEKMNEQTEQAELNEKLIEETKNSIEGYKQIEKQAGNLPNKLKVRMDYDKNTLKKLQKDQQVLKKQMQDTSDKMSQDVRMALRKGMEDAEKDAKDFSDFCTGWGSEAGTPTKMPFREKIKLAEQLRNSHKLKQIAEIVGRMKRLAIAKQKSKTTKIPEEIIDVEIGNNLDRILPSELVLLAMPETELVFLKKYTNNELLQYKMSGKERVGRGPIVVCVDNSGSMSGQREIWSKAVALGLLHLAIQQKRHFACIHFGSTVGRTIKFTPKEDSNERLKKIIEMCEYFEGGGTDFQEPIDEAFEVITRSDDYKKADLVMITDGECDVNDDWLEDYLGNKKIMELKTISVNLGGYESEVLNKLSDIVIPVEELTTDDTKVAGEVFSLIR